MLFFTFAAQTLFMTLKVYLGVLFISLFFALQVRAQKTVIHIERARVANYDVKLGKDVQRLIGDVKLRQDSTIFFCDSAYLNEKTRNFDAFGHVYINVNDSLDIYSKRLKYNGDTRIAELFENVKMIDDSTVLNTEYMLYNRFTRIATYPNHGVITSGDKKLISEKGYYRSDIKEFYFRKDVELITPKYTAYSDTMVYNTISEIAYFYGPSVIRSEENTLYCTFGSYDTKKDQAHLKNRPSIFSMEQTLTADSMFYDRNTGFGKAAGKVEIVDTNYQVIISGAFGQMWEEEGKSYVTDSALAITYDKNDSLFMHADSLFLYFDKDRQAKQMQAYRKVRFYRTDLQGKCDSLAYLMSDSTIRMYYDPVLWSEENQLTADSISIAMRNQQVDSLVMYNSAFIVSRDTIKGFNQIKGKNMVSYFMKNELYRIAVDGNSQTVYWVREEDGSLIGINLARSSTMVIKLFDSQIRRIIYQSTPTETMYPENEVPQGEATLKGFRWLEDVRPINKNDVYRWVLPEVPKEEKRRNRPQ